mmetsp:Transcript_3644/g.9217  ORF Transcript_3644/g.9217 Transcript_3644/m.9217 type:complete len:227 (+) Transcript_3644:26-706(+)
MLSSLVLSALAFSQQPALRRAPAFRTSVLARSEPGFAHGLNGVTDFPGPFDPLNFSEAPEKVVKYYREAELQHGRVGMLAALGFLVQESYHPLFNNEKLTGPAIEHIPELPSYFWVILTFAIGICESYRIQIGWEDPREVTGIDDPDTPENESSGWNNEKSFSLKDSYNPGDLGWDPLGLKPSDPAEFAELQTKELNNGRLGMIAAAGFLAQETVNHKAWLDNLGF